MKEYGHDLKNQYLRQERMKQSLVNKIRKRNQFLIKTAGDKVLDRTNLVLKFDSDNPALLLDQIIAIEKAYTDQSEQLDMFDVE